MNKGIENYFFGLFKSTEKPVVLPSRRAIFFKKVAGLSSAILASATIGCAPVGTVAEKQLDGQNNTTADTYEQPTKIDTPEQSRKEEQKQKIGELLNDMAKQIFFPEPAWTKIAPEDKEQILSSPLARVIQGMTDRFTPKQLEAIMHELPGIYSYSLFEGKERWIPRFNPSMARALARDTVSVHLSFPEDDDLAKRGLSVAGLSDPIGIQAAAEWKTRYAKNLTITNDPASASFAATYIVADTVEEYNVHDPIERFSTQKNSPLIGEYAELAGTEIKLPALGNVVYFGERKDRAPKNVLDAQDMLFRSKFFSYQVVAKITGNQQSSDPYDVGYGAIQSIAAPFSEVDPSTSDVLRVRGTDGLDWGIVPRNTEIAMDKSNLLVQALIEVVSRDDFTAPTEELKEKTE